MHTNTDRYPKTLILSDPPGRWSASAHSEWGKTMNGVESWVYALHGDYCSYQQITPRDLERYDLVIANTQHLETMIYLAERRPERLRWVMLIEGDANEYLLLQPLVQRAIAVSDLVNCINQESLPMFRELARGTDTRVEYIGIPYPVAGVRQCAIPLERRLNRPHQYSMICAPLLSRSNDYLVARELGISYYGYERSLLRKIRTVKEMWREKSFDKYVYIKRAKRLYNDPNLEVRLATPLQYFFTENAAAYLWINLDPRYTWGRYVLDAAALGIPIITTSSTVHGTLLFPQTTVANHFEIETAITIGKQLVEDREFYRAVSEYASEQIQEYAPERITAKLIDSLFH